MSKSEITVKKYNYDTKQSEIVIENLSTHLLAQSFESTEQLASFFSNFLNSGGKDFRNGKALGLEMRSDHRTLQGLAVRFCLGVIVGLSEQEHTDARNEYPVALGKQLKKMLEDGELNMGYMI